ncbi:MULTISPECIES: ATP-binding cassette domain-containing protein [Aneurinibacillus]|uniref:ABC transporter ATP-binding protein n=1 Tax=Aneurinibacillus thermoaerophilus TaxID=143495 RepID=A0A1G7YDK7_ANETH|nr:MULTISPECIES: ABC transporter ATP-binding protein [Aneurinibacillus]AMA72204.1 multidrug ABC transporter ATP-binding protein [Aneurinibacillus sp. XH2]MED0676491.1 ABC transporter ATP-binding protein [Aneurinibacillus thermoaerophilus]MED0679003.1 ABC transporter ATP-binding protein [Aneurinibacillus thermoaerophilus]MED0736540.1 ABC transporter ATP-binding protein [Aneurinibacillus thermoaerophilus]MED0756044.1 ABC transporter ATP-binding protein [Aneurinibacillus thermoaerophilus]
MSFIHVSNLRKEYAYYRKEVGLLNSIKNLFHREKLVKEAVQKISFDIDEGEMIAFLGPNGAGKTTTLKILSGILHPTSGEATVMGYVPWERKKEFKMNFSIVMGQKSQLWWDLPANESLYLNKFIYEVEDREYQKTLDELTELLDVKDVLDVQVRRLSLGERMKLELVAALIHRPKVIFLDEPTIGLDLISQKSIRKFLKYYNEETKATIILTTHYMKDVEDLCKRVIIINQGKIAYDGNLNKVNELLNQKKLVKIQFSSPVPQTAVEAYGIVKEHNEFESLIELDREQLKQNSKLILEHLPVSDINVEDIPIEDSITILYKKDEKNEKVAQL